MLRTIGLIAFAGTAALAATLTASGTFAQSADPNSAPNPYRLQEAWPHYPEGRKPGAAIKVQVDHRDGKSVFVFDRCGANDCSASDLPPILKFDADGKFVTAFGAKLFNQPHGLYVDREGNVYAADQTAKNGKGAVVVKFNAKGDVVMTLGKAGVIGNGPDLLSQPSAVVVAPNGDIFVADGHGEKSNDRIVRFSKNGKFLAAWSQHGNGPGEIDTPHGLALDSAGRVYIADRVNDRIDIFENDGTYVTSWTQFGRPSDVAIDKNDTIYVADSQSGERANASFKQGIRIGSVKDGKVTAFIPAPSAEAGGPESVGVDDAGNVYGGWTGTGPGVRRYVKN